MRKRKGRNRRRKPTLYRRISLIGLLALIYAAVFVAPVFIAQFGAAHIGPDILLQQAALDAVTSFIQIFCLLFALTLLRFVWILVWPLLCLLSGLTDYMVSTYHAQISPDSVAVFMESNAREASNFFNAGLIVSLLASLAVAIFGLALMKREKKEPRNRRAALVALLLTIGLIGINGGSMASRFPPYNFLTAASQYAVGRLDFASTTRKNIGAGAAIHTIGDKPQVIVLVIGESARADHFGLNGYERDTTPLLRQVKNLVNFKQTSSCDVWTRIAVPCMLTRATEANKSAIYSETSLISMFKGLGFATAWFGAQNAIDHPLIDIIHEADSYNMLESRQFLDNTIKDEELLPLMDKALEDQSGPVLIVLHTFGSHWQYSARYTPEFEKFTPACAMSLSRHYDAATQISEIKECAGNQEALVNSYDNSILYTDYILDQVIRRLQDKNALMMYTSDHGESLGENGRYLHGYETAPDNRAVPMFWWASDDFIAANPERWQNLVKKSDAPSSHDVIFHSVPDCAGVTSPMIDPALSLCHGEDAAPAPQSVPAAELPHPDFVKPADEPKGETP